MAFCGNCGAQIPDDKKFCASCGAPMSGGNPAQPTYQQPVVATLDPAEFDPADIEKNKTMAGLAYLLFFLPLAVCPESKFGRFHANQGLVLLIFSIGGSIILSIIPIIGWIILLVYPIAVLAFAIIGLMNGLKGLVKELPLIGKIRIIK